MQEESESLLDPPPNSISLFVSPLSLCLFFISGSVRFSIQMSHLDEDESFVRLGTKSATRPDDFRKFRLNFKVYSADPIWTIWMEIVHSIWYNVYYAPDVIHNLQT